MNKFYDCTLDLLKCTISYEPYGSTSDRNRIPDLARKVPNVFDSLVKCPKTNLAAIGNALALVANEMEIVLREMENKAGSSTGQCDEEPSRSNSEGTPEEERTLAEEIICVVHGVVQLIKELIELDKTWDDADDHPKLIRNTEGLLIRSIRIRDCTKEIKDCICVREVAKITEALRNMRVAVASFEKALDAVLAQPVLPTSGSC
ncbi:hypothetical protein CDL15_Pgr020649 [Punica granatum]|uniref:Uncharacterized protein n=1 Tax=Punica granatum TaxID=22663 RepID=A0A218XI95_PUNGR|nr:hypothetical protein CDL15_Pgr020649 [Punica granatum]